MLSVARDEIHSVATAHNFVKCCKREQRKMKIERGGVNWKESIL